MKRTSLYESHIGLGAKMVEFGGFEMPIQYSNLKQEALAVREAAGMFDVSHMGEFFVSGKDAVKFVDYLVTNDFAGAKVGKAVYSPLCREDGTVIDDLISYKLAEDQVMICVNAANISKDWNWISSKAGDFDVKLVDRSEDISLIALQGPNAFKILKEIDKDLEDIDYYSVQVREAEGDPIIYARTGYTGEDGFEIFAPHQVIIGLWQKLLEKEVAPCGLGARDVLRLEVCYPLYGQEIEDDITPLESGLKWTVKLEKDDFIGKQALMASEPRYANIKLLLDKGIPRAGYPVCDQDGNDVGKVTSGSMSVALGKGVAMARVDKSKYNPKSALFVDIRNKKYEAKKHKGPFVNGGHK